MILRWIEIEGLRSYRNRIHLDLDNFTALTGRNDAGKSTVFAALMMFLNSQKPDVTDYTVDGDEDIRVCLSFSDLPESISIDSTVETTLSEEHLLDINGNLTVEKRWRGKAQPTVYVRASQLMKEEKPLILCKNSDLKKIAKTDGVLDQVDDKRVNKLLRRAIWERWETAGGAAAIDEFVPLNVEDGKLIAGALESYYPSFQLFEADRQGTDSDQVAQDPAKLAVKTVLGRRTEQLAKLSREIRAEISDLLEGVVTKLGEIDPGLAESLFPMEAEPNWERAFSAVQFVDEAGVALNKHGSGTRRLVLLSFFHAEIDSLISLDSEEYERGVIIAVEEPETALHPDLQKEAMEAFRELSEIDGRQVIVTTHSSNLVRDLPVGSVRYLDVDERKARAWIAGDPENPNVLLKRLSRTMGIFTYNSVAQFLYVEGKHDIESLRNLTDGIQSVKPGLVTDIRKHEESNELCFIPMGGCGAAELWEDRLSSMRARGWYLIDSDRESENARLKSTTRKYLDWSKQPDCQDFVHVLDRRELENYLTRTAVISAYPELREFARWFDYYMDGEEWNYCDIPRIAAKASVACGARYDSWEDHPKRAKRTAMENAKSRLSAQFAHESVAKSLISDSENDLLCALSQLLK